jgi:alpha-L-fucosidase
VDDLVELHFSSVGRNAKLLLNVPPAPTGRLHQVDVARLRSAHRRLDRMFEEDLAARPRSSWRRPGATGSEAELDLGRTVLAGIARLEEDITLGQVVSRYTLYGSDGGAWQPLSSGTTIGYARLDRFPPAEIRKVRLVVEEAVGPPDPIRISLYPPS